MELWQMDVMGGVVLEDGTELKVVTGLDDHSRFCISAKLVLRATTRPVCEALAEALRPILEIFNRGVLVKAHDRRHQKEANPTIPARSTPRPRPAASPSSDLAVIRMVDPTGCVSFAGTSYRAGKAFRGLQVEVRLLEETVEFWLGGERIRTTKPRMTQARCTALSQHPGVARQKAKAG